MNRHDAPKRVRMASMQALAEGKPLADVLSTDPKVVRCCSKTDIAALLTPNAFTGTAVRQVERGIEKLSPLCG